MRFSSSSFIDFIIPYQIPKNFYFCYIYMHAPPTPPPGSWHDSSLVAYVNQKSEDLSHVLCIVLERVVLALFGFGIPYNSGYSHLLPVSPHFWDTATTCRTTSPVCACEILGWCAVEGGYDGGGSVDSDSNACEQK